MIALSPIVACRQCGTAIRWIRNHNTGNPAPIEVLPTGLGNIAINADGSYSLVTARAGYVGDLHINHRVTCSMAARPPARSRRRPAAKARAA